MSIDMSYNIFLTYRQK